MTDETTAHKEGLEPTSEWENDVLNRKPYAEFLTKSLTQQTTSLMELGGGLTISLDAGWGLGKTFFITKWAKDLANLGHPVIVFDAWENDIGDEAAIALMAAIRQELEKWRGKLPKSIAIQESVKTAATDALAGFRKALMPTAKIVAKGLIKKATGVAVDEIAEAIESGSGDEDKEKAVESATEILETSLDKLLEKALDEHTQRSEAIKKFRESTRKLIQLLSQHTDAELPIFVFIDEADRCRPTYAIKLLEEIKHIFGAPGFCYIVATNSDQLQESIKAVYGAGFNSHAYLKRFFDQQLTLPDPDHNAFAKILLADTSVLHKRRLDLGLPTSDDNALKTPERTVSLIFDTFDLDLRSQRQVIQMANSASSAIDEKFEIHLMWLLFLCTLNHQHPSDFMSVINRRVDTQGFSLLYKEAVKKDTTLNHVAISEYGETLKNTSTPLSRVITNYYEWAATDLKDIRKKSAEKNAYSYPASILHSIAKEMPSHYLSNREYPSSLASYGRLVRFAGMLR